MKHERGFIALISSVIISAALLAAAVSAGSAALASRVGALHGEYKKISYSLAESCVQTALLRLAQNYAYEPAAPGDTVPVGNNACVILSVSVQSSDATGKEVVIVTSARYNSAYTVLHTDATVPNPSASHDVIRIGAFQEVSTA